MSAVQGFPVNCIRLNEVYKNLIPSSSSVILSLDPNKLYLISVSEGIAGIDDCGSDSTCATYTTIATGSAYRSSRMILYRGAQYIRISTGAQAVWVYIAEVVT